MNPESNLVLRPATLLKTTFMAMDLEESKEVLANHDELEAYIIYLDENGETKEFFTPGFEKLVKK